MAADAPWVRVCGVDDIPRGHGLRVSVSGRPVAVFSHGGAFHALDATCYHMGGPLESGDIEELAGSACVRCPWHRYPISLSSGESFYTGMDGLLKSKGPRQRVHRARVEGASVEVQLNQDPAPLASDEYACKPAPVPGATVRMGTGPGGTTFSVTFAKPR